MKSDPLERLRRKDKRWTRSEVWSGALGLGLLFLPVGPAFRWFSAAATGTSYGALIDPGQAALLALALGAVLALSALFVASETSLQLLRPVHVRLREDGSSSQKVLRDLLDGRERFIAASVLGSQTMRAWLVLLCLIPAADLKELLGWQQAGHWGLVGAAVMISVPVVGANVVLSDLVARSLATLRPDLTAVRYASLIRLFAMLFHFPAQLAMGCAGLVTKRFGATASFDAENRAEEAIRDLLDTYKETGEIEQEEQTMINSVFEFGDTVAREIMTPRVDLESVPQTATVAELAALIEETGHSRFPVFEASDDQIVGMVHAKDILAAYARGEVDAPLSSLKIRPVLFVPENKPLHDLLAEMKSEKAQLVVVQDEHGGTAGIVTVEDIVEEVVGEIVDEYDDEQATVLADGVGYMVSGRLHLDDVNVAAGTGLQSDEFDTLGGYVFGLFGRQPAEGEHVESGGHRFTVVSTDGRRIETVRVERVAEAGFFASEVLSEPTG